MKWIKTENVEYYSCHTPVGRYDVVGSSSGYNTYLGTDVISREKELETAKEEAKVHLQTTYYKIKIYLDL